MKLNNHLKTIMVWRFFKTNWSLLNFMFWPRFTNLYYYKSRSFENEYKNESQMWLFSKNVGKLRFIKIGTEISKLKVIVFTLKYLIVKTSESILVWNSRYTSWKHGESKVRYTF